MIDGSSLYFSLQLLLRLHRFCISLISLIFCTHSAKLFIKMTHVVTVIARLERFADLEESQIKQLIANDIDSSFSEHFLSSRAIEYKVKLGNDGDIDRVSKLLKHKQLESTTYDIIFQSANRSKKLVVFDMDSTLIYQEVIELIAAYANIEDRVAEITERAMNGELDFTQSLHERVKLLKGIDATSIWDELKLKLEITEGAKELCKALKKLGYVLMVCSGGFIPLAEHLKDTLGLDYAFANQLGVDENQVLNGTTKGYIVNGEKKANLLVEIAAKHSIDTLQALAIGDGANDLPMMAVAGFGVAWHAKPKVQQLAPSCLNSKSLLDVMYILGHTEDEIKSLLSA